MTLACGRGTCGLSPDVPRGAYAVVAFRAKVQGEGPPPWLDELGRETLLELRQALAATANRLRRVPNTDGISRTLKGWRAKWTRRGRIPPKILARVERRRTSEKEGRVGSAA